MRIPCDEAYGSSLHCQATGSHRDQARLPSRSRWSLPMRAPARNTWWWLWWIANLSCFIDIMQYKNSQGEDPKQQGSMPPSSRGSPPLDACSSQRKLLGCKTCGAERAPGVRQIFQLMKQYLTKYALRVIQYFSSWSNIFQLSSSLRKIPVCRGTCQDQGWRWSSKGA